MVWTYHYEKYLGYKIEVIVLTDFLVGLNKKLHYYGKVGYSILVSHHGTIVLARQVI